MNIDSGTVTALVTLLIVAAVVIGWRRYGLIGGLTAAIIACVIAGSYSAPVRNFLTSATRLWEAPAEAIRSIIS